MKSNGGIIGTGSSYRRRGETPTSSGIWSVNNARSFMQSGRPTNNISEMKFIASYENLSSNTASATQTFFDVSIGPYLQNQKRIVALIGTNDGSKNATLSSARLSIDTAPSQLLGNIVSTVDSDPDESDNQRFNKSHIVYWDIPESAGNARTADLVITYSAIFDEGPVDNSFGTIVGLYYIENEAEIVQTTAYKVIYQRNTPSITPSITYPKPVGYTLCMLSTNSNSTSADGGFSTGGLGSIPTRDFLYQGGGTSRNYYKGGSVTHTSPGTHTINPALSILEGEFFVVNFSTGKDYEAVLSSDGSYIEPTAVTTSIPSTAGGISDDASSDFLVTIDISNFTNTDTGVLYEIGGGSGGSGRGISLGMVSGELHVNIGDGGDAFDQLANANTDLEVIVASTTMDNYNGQDITLCLAVGRSLVPGSDSARITVQPGGRGSTSNMSTLYSTTGDLWSTQTFFGTNTRGFGTVGSAVARIGTTANYAGTITEIREYINTSIVPSKITTLT